MNEMSPSRGRYFPQLDALRGIAALMVVINHFLLVESALVDTQVTVARAGARP